MDENENKSNVGENVKAKLGGVVELVKSHKKVLLGLIVVLVALFLLFGVFGNGKKAVIKDYIKAGNKGDGKKMVKTMDMAGMSVYMQLAFSGDDLEDFYDEYKDYIDSDEWEDAEEDMDEYIEDMIDEIEEPDDDEKVKIKKFGDIEKESKNLWKVEVEVEVDDEEEDVEFYVMKKGLKYYIVGVSGM